MIKPCLLRQMEIHLRCPSTPLIWIFFEKLILATVFRARNWRDPALLMEKSPCTVLKSLYPSHSRLERLYRSNKFLEFSLCQKKKIFGFAAKRFDSFFFFEQMSNQLKIFFLYKIRDQFKQLLIKSSIIESTNILIEKEFKIFF
jgi:hypothetical protein